MKCLVLVYLPEEERVSPLNGGVSPDGKVYE